MTVTSELEAMARAMVRCVEAETGNCWSELGYASLEAWVDVSWPNYVSRVRAALLAIREPEGALLRQIQRIRFAMRVGKITGLAAEGPAFTAIIDYLLAEPQP